MNIWSLASPFGQFPMPPVVPTSAELEDLLLGKRQELLHFEPFALP
jgi:hypothetical protein